MMSMSIIGIHPWYLLLFIFFFFNDTATTEIYTLSLHDALPICDRALERYRQLSANGLRVVAVAYRRLPARRDRKSTRLNSSHVRISYAVFCLKKKKTKYIIVHEATTADDVCS